jgi:hemolysin III
MMTTPPTTSSPTTEPAAQPILRGWTHVVAFLVALPAGIVLLLRADTALTRAAAAIYATSILLSFGTSAAYHRLARSPRARAIMQRLDHSMIYLLIAGTYVPTCLVGLPLRWGIPLLAVVGVGAVTGVVLKLAAFHRVQWLSYSLYLVIGWAAIGALPGMIWYLPTTPFLLIIGGGALYTLGFPVLLLKRPDPWPRMFGYHEVWHVLTVLAATLHFVAVAMLVT